MFHMVQRRSYNRPEGGGGLNPWGAKRGVRYASGRKRHHATKSHRETHCARYILYPKCKICCHNHLVLNKHIHILLLAASTFHFSWFHFLCEKESAFVRQNNTQSAVYARPEW